MKKWVITIPFILVLGLWFGTFFVITRTFEQSQWGIIGDLFGAINALFSGLAFAGVVVALFLQREDLKVQQEQLKRSNEEFAQQNKILQDQLSAMKESLGLELLRQQSENEPSFQHMRTVSDPYMKKCFLRNKGGRFKLMNISCSPDIRVTPTPERGATVHRDDEITLLIQHRQRPIDTLPKGTLRVTLHCQLPNLGEVRKNFDFEDGRDTPTETQGR